MIDYFPEPKYKIEFPRNFVGHSSILPVLEQLNLLINNKFRTLPRVAFDFTKLHRLSSLGVLLFYKILDFNFNNKCFQLPLIQGDERFLKSVYNHYGFTELFNSYFKEKPSNQSYNFLQFRTEGNIIIAPQPLLRNDNEHVNDFLQNKFAPQLNDFYCGNNGAVDMIFGCISEIIGNFWEHATNDNNSILVAEGDYNNIRISCADIGFGITTTLRKSGRFENKATDETLLAKALTKGVTSKPDSNHMGYGLWLVDSIVTEVKGVLHIYTNGVYYKNEYGKKAIKRGGYWQGTIIYIDLPLKKPVRASQIIEKEISYIGNSLKINFA